MPSESRSTDDSPASDNGIGITFGAVVIGLIGIVSAGHFFLRSDLANIKHDAAVVNMAGRQRMRSQRLAKTMLCIGAPQAALIKETCLHELTATIDAMNQGDDELRALVQAGDAPPLRAALHHLHETNERYSALVTTSLDKPFEPSFLGRLSLAERDSLEAAETVTKLLTERAESRLSAIETEQLYCDAVEIFAVLCLGAFLLRPLRRRIRRMLSQLREREAALTLSQNRMQAIFNNAQQSFILVGGNDHVLALNDVARGIWQGLSKPMSEGNSIRDFVQPQNLAAFDEQLAAARRGEVSVLERCVVDPAGRHHWFESAYAPVANGDDHHAVCISSLDITARKQAELAVRESEQRFRNVVQHSSDIISVVALDGTIIFESPAMERILGHHAASLVGQSCFEHFHRDDHAAIRAAFRSLDTLGKEVSVSYRVRHKDGHFVPMQSLGTRIESGQGEAQFLVNSRDITNQQREEQQLRGAKQKAEDATAAKASFLAHMSHEIRTPLNAVIGLTTLLLDSALDAEQRDNVETIRVSGDALLHIINDVLDFSKLESERFELDLKPFALRSYLEQAIAITSVAAKRKRLALYTRIDEDIPTSLVGDAPRMRQVLLNLLSNAVKFTNAGEIVVAVSRCSDDRLRFAVTDTGVGLSAESRARLFQPFTQADASIAGQYGGTGLGLAISKRLIELMGGEMGVTSTVGLGTTFYFDIPATAVCELAERPVVAAQRQPQHQRVLLVDDNPINLKVGRKTLEKLGCSIICANGGVEALAALGLGEFDLVLLDLHMPEMDGAETARHMRRQHGVRTPKIVALTASVTAEEKQKCVEAGMQGFLTKPLQTDALEKVLDETPPAQILTEPIPPAHTPPARETVAQDEAFDVSQLQKILELSEDDDDVAGEVITSFLSAAPSSVSAMGAAISARDAKQLRLSAHTLRGTSGVLGLKRVQTLAAALEESALKEADEWAERGDCLCQIQQALVGAEAMLLSVQAGRQSDSAKT